MPVRRSLAAMPAAQNVAGQNGTCDASVWPTRHCLPIRVLLVQQAVCLIPRSLLFVDGIPLVGHQHAAGDASGEIHVTASRAAYLLSDAGCNVGIVCFFLVADGAFILRLFEW